MIYYRRWYNIKGETIEPGSKHAMSVVRIQTTQDGAWQALTDKELDQLIIDHNKMINEEKPKSQVAKIIEKVVKKTAKKALAKVKKK